MADWSANVGITQAYTTLLSLLAARDVDAVTLAKAAYTNPPDGAIAWVRASSKFQEWNLGGAAYADMVLSIAGGGTGASTAATARTSLGLGSMAVQAAGAVAITGGTVQADLTGSTNVPAGALVGGPIAQARLGSGSAGAGAKFLADDQTYKAVSVTPAIQAVQTADFTASVLLGGEVVYPLSGSHVITLPTVVGHAGQIFTFPMRGTGTWTINCNGAETILGAVSLTYDWGQYASITIVADANSGVWDII